MKKLFIALSVGVLFTACQKDNESNNSTDQSINQRQCASHEVLERQMQEDPELQNRMINLESFVQDAIKNGRLVNGKIVIPVVFNVLYRTNSENIALNQLQSQIDVLNEDFNAGNSDYNSPNNPYASVRANIGISFELNQVIRKSTTKTSWGTRDAMKNSKKGGINPTSPTTNLNIWVCTIGGGILGYAQFPGGSSKTDGVVLDSRYTGNIGTATYPFNLGRTATHEVGHWMNLRHIWGDATCGNDYVNDTPLHNAPNYGVPAVGHLSTCSGTPLEMFMNYMDYTDDRGMYMFSLDQKARMEAIFAVGGPRNSFAQP